MFDKPTEAPTFQNTFLCACLYSLKAFYDIIIKELFYSIISKDGYKVKEVPV
jgi:hypothetical protein